MSTPTPEEITFTPQEEILITRRLLARLMRERDTLTFRIMTLEKHLADQTVAAALDNESKGEEI